MLIQIETKEGMGEKALEILNGLKDVVIEKIEVRDLTFIQKKNELLRIYENAIENPESLKTHDDVWREIDGLHE